jgi:hypothetical protein
MARKRRFTDEQIRERRQERCRRLNANPEIQAKRLSKLRGKLAERWADPWSEVNANMRAKARAAIQADPEKFARKQRIGQAKYSAQRADWLRKQRAKPEWIEKMLAGLRSEESRAKVSNNVKSHHADCTVRQAGGIHIPKSMIAVYDRLIALGYGHDGAKRLLRLDMRSMAQKAEQPLVDCLEGDKLPDA